jgi:hypothetical protein
LNPKGTNVGSNTKTYNGQKFDNGLLGLSFGNYISKEKLFAKRFAIVKNNFNFKINFNSSELPAQK